MNKRYYLNDLNTVPSSLLKNRLYFNSSSNDLLPVSNKAGPESGRV